MPPPDHLPTSKELTTPEAQPFPQSVASAPPPAISQHPPKCDDGGDGESEEVKKRRPVPLPLRGQGKGKGQRHTQYTQAPERILLHCSVRLKCFWWRGRLPAKLLSHYATTLTPKKKPSPSLFSLFVASLSLFSLAHLFLLRAGDGGQYCANEVFRFLSFPSCPHVPCRSATAYLSPCRCLACPGGSRQVRVQDRGRPGSRAAGACPTALKHCFG